MKVGDGIILATLPPYNHFLKAGVDFAIICSGMPPVDCRVQEFMQHEISCMIAGYLVEFVCKPSYSLEKYVQLQDAWAEKSFTNLSNRLDIIMENTMPSERNSDSAKTRLERFVGTTVEGR
ncbi:hypothetical protein ACLOJK_024175 [Asimina triloba]